MKRSWLSLDSRFSRTPSSRASDISLRSRYFLAMFFTLLLGGCGADPTDTFSTLKLYINEFMAQNDTTIADTDGNGGYPDWIELYNAETADIDLGGMYLTDDLDNPTKWQIPDGVVISAGGYLIFWADNDPPQGNTHMTFKLNTTGEDIGLFDTTENSYTAIDAITFGTQTPDVSSARIPDGSTTWQACSSPSPGTSNG